MPSLFVEQLNTSVLLLSGIHITPSEIGEICGQCLNIKLKAKIDPQDDTKNDMD
jgi:hypothetical protein